MVDRYGGSANKNIGDAFLLVWKFSNQEDFTKHVTPGLQRKISKENQEMADLALFSFLKIIAKINKLTHILEYSHNEAMNARLPGYKVKMGFGLHQGWAIEGAIGSTHKIDASYLSPNVNMASRLEAATKQYGVCLLLSEFHHEVLSPEIQKLCREVDTVTVKGSKHPIKLFTVDIETDGLPEKHDNYMDKTIHEKKKHRNHEKAKIAAQMNQGQLNSWDIFA